VIPAYNAAATLPETLESVLAQTCRAIEVVVVDDGSTDATPDIAAESGRRDRRVRLLRQANAGVAVARNRGIAATSGPFVAFVDADDLWAPDKVARQVAALEAAGDGTALCYTWYDIIDAAGAIRQPGRRPTHQGAVLAALCQDNFVGTASSMLIRRPALDRVGGFDASLRARGAQGCEDYDLLLRIAEAYRFALVTDALVGYRTGSGAMSADTAKMLRSWRMVAEQAARRRPELTPLLARGCIDYAVFLILGALRRGRVMEAAGLAAQLGLPPRRLAPPLARAAGLRMVQAAAKLPRRSSAAPRRFAETGARLV
jgi:glycosyltransferase involved in cell wall biosynthesis